MTTCLGRATISKFNRNIFYGVAFMAALVVSEVQSVEHSGSIQLRNTVAGVVTSDPGQTVNIGFLVENRGDRKRELIEELVLPDGWRNLVPAEAAFTVAPGARELRLFAVRIPAGASSGLSEVEYSVRTAEDSVLRGTVSRTVGVAGLLRLELTVENQPRSVIAGGSYEAVFRVANLGNAAMEVDVEASGNPDYPIAGVPEAFGLAPGESRLVRLQVSTEGEGIRKRRHFLQVQATGDAGQRGEAAARAATSVDVDPAAVAVADPYHRIPARLRVMGGYDDDRGGGMQAELSGAGAIDESGLRGVDFLFRSPGAEGVGGVRGREEYRFDYYDESWDMGVGDRTFSLSPLTQRFGYGRGAEVNVYPGDTGLGAYHRQSRPGQPDQRESGTYLAHDLGLFSVKGNFLQRTADIRTEAGDVRDRLYSVEGRVRPQAGPEVGVEVAHGERRTDVSRADYAVRLDVQGRAGDDVYYTLEKVHAGSDFFGEYRDMRNLYGALRFPLYGRLRGNASYRWYRINLDQDPERRSTAPREVNYRTGVSYPSAFGTRFTADFRRRERMDLIDPEETDFEVHSVELGVNHRFNRWGFRGTVEGGIIEDHTMASERSPLERYSAYLDFFPTNGQQYSAFGRTGHDAFLADPGRSQSAGVSGRWKFTSSVTARARYSRTWTASDREFERGAAGVGYRMPNEHFVELDGQWSREATSGEERAGVFVSYTIPFGIPVRKKKGLGGLQGRVVENGEPLAGAVVTANGIAAVTDRNGRFEFTGLKEDVYTVRLDQRSIPSRWTTAEPMPKVVEIFEGETAEVNMEVVETGRIFGQVVRYEFEDEPIFSDDDGSLNPEESERPSIRDAGGLAGVRVEIRSPRKTRSTITDENGRFEFQQLRPGPWSVRVAPVELPPHHSLAREEVDVTLRPGGDELILMRVIPRERRIRLIDEQTVR